MVCRVDHQGAKPQRTRGQPSEPRRRKRPNGPLRAGGESFRSDVPMAESEAFGGGENVAEPEVIRASLATFRLKTDHERSASSSAQNAFNCRVPIRALQVTLRFPAKRSCWRRRAATTRSRICAEAPESHDNRKPPNGRANRPIKSATFGLFATIRPSKLPD